MQPTIREKDVSILQRRLEASGTDDWKLSSSGTVTKTLRKQRLVRNDYNFNSALMLKGASVRSQNVRARLSNTNGAQCASDLKHSTGPDAFQFGGILCTTHGASEAGPSACGTPAADARTRPQRVIKTWGHKVTQLYFVAILSQRECVGRVIKCAT